MNTPNYNHCQRQKTLTYFGHLNVANLLWPWNSFCTIHPTRASPDSIGNYLRAWIKTRYAALESTGVALHAAGGSTESVTLESTGVALDAVDGSTESVASQNAFHSLRNRASSRSRSTFQESQRQGGQPPSWLLHRQSTLLRLFDQHPSQPSFFSSYLKASSSTLLERKKSVRGSKRSTRVKGTFRPPWFKPRSCLHVILTTASLTTQTTSLAASQPLPVGM
ncbi:uncharacterized protein EV420DRAFT_1554859 [Desarmillaria tabescens]|uniref:Uncharacterized protein n=1 Tax=Armillaria tabescens TaxID=1929756 RepID=A0AA39N2X8_ARMTA|nr:uncharacterized protein EV420DRAFT_1554859 [Desarmillaria tabescens]KAK0455240.1 hypothetical protein EV420DRAFT_1554859 [Desarmillaria tabescens]